ncbi:hypothetical protein VTK73DRAFT_4198 [Phialemonium thermophilum]|uniref:Uncharacterized protein n=1 Tax=Phialemonium thermophilum TaxID=223376 RepID=A0ABR3VAQ5_9PEZI
MGTGADSELSEEMPMVVVEAGSGGWCGAGSSAASWISPVQATTVWFQGVSSDERRLLVGRRAARPVDKAWDAHA